MTPIIHRCIDHPSAWRGADLGSKDAYSVDLESRHLRALDDALARVRRRGLGLHEISRESFGLPAIEADVAGWYREVQERRGLVLLRGFPIDRYGMEDLEAVYWGLGAHFGRGLSQSVMGDRVGHVRDTSDQDPNARAYRNKQELNLHTDLCDIIMMLSVTTAARGGLSRYASAVSVHNRLREEHPAWLEPLYRGFHYYRMGEEGPGELPFTPHPVPVYSSREGYLTCRYVRAYIHAGAKLRGEKLSDLEVEALDGLDRIAFDQRLELLLEPGEMSIINNYVVLHARSGFQDDRAGGACRHLLRLWLECDDARPVVPEIEIFPGRGIAQQAGKRPSGEGEFLERLIEEPVDY